MHAQQQRPAIEAPARRVDFFIYGTPKCGTTSLHTWLDGHPQISMSASKAPHYYDVDLQFPERIATRDRDAYLNLFDGELALMRGEASASYLYSRVAAKRILADNPLAKFIILVRHPVVAAHSAHSQLLGNLTENEPDFERAWSLQRVRARGQFIPPHCVEPRFLQYRDMYTYTPHIERLLALVKPAQVLILVTEEMGRDPRRAYEQILAFLGLPSDGRTEFPRENTNKFHRSPLLNRLARRPPTWLGAVKRAANACGFRPRVVVDRLNTRRTARSPLRPAFRTQLEREFEPDVRRLERLLGRELGWF